MPRVLMCWEFGQNYGHVMPLLPVAKALRSAGYEVVFALKDLRQVGQAVVEAGFPILQAPAHPEVMVAPHQTQPESMADILQLSGYERPHVLGLYLRAWRELMQLARPDLVVASYAPTALLAARTLKVKSALVGTAFEFPPAQTPSPSFRSRADAPRESLQASEDAVVRGVNDALKPHGRSINAVFEVFAADRQLLWTFPELDVHADIRRAAPGGPPTYCGAIFAEEQGSPAVWPTGSSRKVLGYLRYSGQRLADVVTTLETVDAGFCLVVPGLKESDAERLRRRNITLSARPVRLRSALEEADALLSYGGHGTVCASLLAGRPMLLMPEHMESLSIARRAARLGAAVIADPDSSNVLPARIGQVLREARWRDGAQRFARRYRGYNPTLQAGRIARILAECIAGAQVGGRSDPVQAHAEIRTSP